MKINCEPLPMEIYHSDIHLDEPFLYQNPAPEEEHERVPIIDDLLAFLYSESKIKKDRNEISYEMKRKELYSLLTVRNPKPLPSWFYEKLGCLLQRESMNNRVSVDSLQPISQKIPESKFRAAEKCALWKGDITTLQCDVIVNAANKYLLGCFRPFHRCIDNAIHSVAGPMLREDCNTIIRLQGCNEETGWAKITRAYNLPSKYVIHTVGPIYNKSSGIVLRNQKQELAKCYTSCLDLANQIPSIRTVAFCSISTGEFGFPLEPATQIALDTVEEWVELNPKPFDLIIFNVFNENDYDVYKKFLMRG